MKYKLRLLALLLSAVILGVPASAQQESTQSLRVAVGADSENAKDIVSQLDAKIGGTMRYSLGETLGESTLTIDVTCVRLHTVTNDASLGYACSSQVGYFPSSSSPLHAHFPGDTVVCDRSGEYCAEGIFDDFVAETQPDKLKAAEADLAAKYASIYSAGYAAGYEAGLKAGKTPTSKKAPQSK